MKKIIDIISFVIAVIFLLGFMAYCTLGVIGEVETDLRAALAIADGMTLMYLIELFKTKFGWFK